MAYIVFGPPVPADPPQSSHMPMVRRLLGPRPPFGRTVPGSADEVLDAITKAGGGYARFDLPPEEGEGPTRRMHVNTAHVLWIED